MLAQSKSKIAETDTEEFEEIVSETIDEVLREVLGEKSTEVIYGYLEDNVCPVLEIPLNLPAFSETLNGLLLGRKSTMGMSREITELGTVSLLERAIAKVLCEKLGADFTEVGPINLPTFIGRLRVAWTQKTKTANQSLKQDVERAENEEAGGASTTEQVPRRALLFGTEDVLRAILASSPEAITLTDLDANIVECSQATLSLHGFQSREELIGKSAFTLIAEKDRAKAVLLMKNLVEKGLVKNVECTLLTKDGKEFPAEICGILIRDSSGRPLSIVAISKDLTERKKAEELFNREHRLLHVLMDNIPDISVYFKDRSSRFTLINKAHAERMGFNSADEAIGKTDFDFYSKEFAQETYNDEQEIMKKGQPLIHKIEKVTKPNAPDRWVLATKVPIKDEEGQITGIVGISKDVTEIFEMKEELRKRSEELERLVEEKTAKLQAAQRLATIGETVAMVGHDIRNPSQAIVGFLYLMRKKLRSLSSPEKQGLSDLCDKIEIQVKYIDKIVSDLQDLARPLQPELVETDIQALIREIISSAMIPEEAEVAVNVVGTGKDPRIDPVLMKRVLTNMIANALQAMPSGGRLGVRIVKKEEGTFVSISDTGVGISEENMNRIFQPFFTTKSRGQGLGLFVCKLLVEAQGGSITVESKLGKGTTFTIKMPRDSETAQKQRSPLKPPRKN